MAIAIATFDIYDRKFTGYLILYALSARVNKIFQKQTVFAFTESWSHDQLMQKACS